MQSRPTTILNAFREDHLRHTSIQTIMDSQHSSSAHKIPEGTGGHKTRKKIDGNLDQLQTASNQELKD